jgi:UDP-N-acetylglucosamine acyltransferase
MAGNIHPSAIVSKKAIIGNNVKIGPYCIVGDNAELADEVELVSHVVIDGYTKIGEETKIFPFASISGEPQDLKFHGEKSVIKIGKRNKIREYVTIHPGTEAGGMETVVGDDCLLMAGVHIAHDCKVGNNVIMANYATLAGHVIVEDFAIIGGLSAIAQRVRVGAYSFVGGMTGVAKNVIPFGITGVEVGYLDGLNLIGLKRKNFSREDILALQSIYKTIFMETEGDFDVRVNKVASDYSNNSLVMQVVDFIKNATLNSVLTPKK